MTSYLSHANSFSFESTQTEMSDISASISIICINHWDLAADSCLPQWGDFLPQLIADFPIDQSWLMSLGLWPGRLIKCQTVCFLHAFWFSISLCTTNLNVPILMVPLLQARFLSGHGDVSKSAERRESYFPNITSFLQTVWFLDIAI